MRKFEAPGEMQIATNMQFNLPGTLGENLARERRIAELMLVMNTCFDIIAHGPREGIEFSTCYRTATDLILYKQWEPVRLLALSTLRRLSLVSRLHEYSVVVEIFREVTLYHERVCRHMPSASSLPSLLDAGNALYHRPVAARWRRVRLGVTLLREAHRRLTWWLAFFEFSCQPESGYVKRLSREFYALAE